MTISAGLAGWVEMWLLRSALNDRVGYTGLPLGLLGRLWASALIGATFGWAVKLSIPPVHPVVAAGAILGPFGAGFVASAYLLGVSEASAALDRLSRVARAAFK